MCLWDWIVSIKIVLVCCFFPGKKSESKLLYCLSPRIERHILTQKIDRMVIWLERMKDVLYFWILSGYVIIVRVKKNCLREKIDWMKKKTILHWIASGSVYVCMCAWMFVCLCEIVSFKSLLSPLCLSISLSPSLYLSLSSLRPPFP